MFVTDLETFDCQEHLTQELKSILIVGPRNTGKTIVERALLDYQAQVPANQQKRLNSLVDVVINELDCLPIDLITCIIRPFLDPGPLKLNLSESSSEKEELLYDLNPNVQVVEPIDNNHVPVNTVSIFTPLDDLLNKPLERIQEDSRIHVMLQHITHVKCKEFQQFDYCFLTRDWNEKFKRKIYRLLEQAGCTFGCDEFEDFDLLFQANTFDFHTLVVDIKRNRFYSSRAPYARS